MKDREETLLEKKYKETVFTQLWRFLGMIAIGGLAGYLVYRSSVKSGSPNIIYLFVIWGIFFIIGAIIFLINVIKAKKYLNKQIKLQEELENKTQ